MWDGGGIALHMLSETWHGRHASRSTVSEFMQVEWHTVGGMCARVYRELETANLSRFNTQVNIGIDEISY